jgi:putative ABC transport system permease protein
VLSHGLWVRRYGQDPNILGRAVMLNGMATVVVGVMPPSFLFPDPRTDMWIAAQPSRGVPSLFNYASVARLADRRTLSDARNELTRLITELARESATQRPFYIRLNSTAATLIDSTVGHVASALWILLASVGLVLLVACANVANLFLVRSEARQREVAVRRALGAGTGGIGGYFMAESGLLSMLGGTVGLALAWGAIQLLLAFGPTNLPRLHEVRLDAIAVAFTLALSLLTGVAFGSMPLLRLGTLAASLHESGRGNTASRGRQRARHVLMAGQVGMALVLLVSSGLMLRSFQKLRAVDPGFNATSALTFRVGLPSREYPTRATSIAAHRAILDRLSMMPGVTAASASTCLPLAERCAGNGLRVEGRVVPAGTITPSVKFHAIADGYFEAMGMRILRGRGIDRGDIDRNEPNVVVDQALVNRYFPQHDPIGQRIASWRPGSLTWLTIVGLVGNTPTSALAESNPMAKLYMPMSIAGGPDIAPLTGADVGAMSFVVRTATPRRDLLGSVRRSVAEVDPGLAVADVRTLQDILDRASAQMAFTMVLLAIAAGVALLLGVIGIYGVMSYIVIQRTGEIGVRLALGAKPASVAALIVQQGGIVALGGIAVGLVAALAGGRLIESLLYGVSPRDPVIFVATTLTLLTVTLIACWLPARRAAHLSPLEALRTD